MHSPRPTVLFVLLLTAALWLPAHAAGPSSFGGMVVFGDSLSDTGNLASATFPFPYPYYQNRVSNGPVAVEELAGLLVQSLTTSFHLVGRPTGNNYAVAGANVLGNDAENLKHQVAAFLNLTGGVAPPDWLYVLFIGGNDIIPAARWSDLELSRKQARKAARRLARKARKIVIAGARYLLIVKVPDIGLIPESVARDRTYPGAAVYATKVARAFNRQLGKKIRKIEAELGIDIAGFNSFKWLRKLIADAPTLAFTNTVDGCFNSQTLTFHPDCQLGARFNRFVFFDEIHPTAATHRYWGRALHQKVSTHSWQ